jgi:plastocyanin
MDDEHVTLEPNSGGHAPWLKRPVVLIAIGLTVVLVFSAGIGVWAVTQQSNKNAAKPVSHPVAVVLVTSAGFVPAALEIKAGTKVVWVNKDVNPHQVAADPYPAHSELPSLFSKQAMAQNQTYSFLFTKVRAIGYHDELNPTISGTITVK